MSKEIKNKVKSSLFWSFADQFVTQVVFILFSIYLARILSPDIFGVVGMITVFTNFAIHFIDMGFGVALIQKKDADTHHYSSVFWLNLFIGMLLYGLFFLAAPFISTFYDHPELTLLIRVICLIFIISSLSSVQANLMVRELEFKRKVIYNWIANLIGYGLAFYLAYNDYGVWALVGMTLATALVNSVLCWFFSKWRPEFVFHWSKIKELSGFGLNVLGDTTVNYWSRNYDNFIIGKVLGSTDLGLYSRAYSLMMLPMRNVTAVISRVLFPAFSKIQDDVAKIQTAYLEVIKYIAAITFPAMVGMSLVSKEFVLLFFGAQWSKMIPVLSLLCLLGAVQSIVALNGLIYNSLGKANIAFRISLVVNLILIITFTVCVRYGIYGLSLGYLIVGSLLSWPVYHIALKQINLTVLDVLKQLKGILISLMVMALTLLFLNYILDIDPLLAFVLKVMAGSLVYLLFVFIFEKPMVVQLKAKITKFRNNEK
ncbi:MOP flippase family protein [Flavobacterium pedocola]